MTTKITDLAAVPEGTNKAFDIDGKMLLVCHSSKGVFVTNVECPHQNQSLEGGKLKAHFLFCPVHGVRFDLTTGAPRGQLTQNHLTLYAVTVEDGIVYADLTQA